MSHSKGPFVDCCSLSSVAGCNSPSGAYGFGIKSPKFVGSMDLCTGIKLVLAGSIADFSGFDYPNLRVSVCGIFPCNDFSESSSLIEFEVIVTVFIVGFGVYVFDSGLVVVPSSCPSVGSTFPFFGTAVSFSVTNSSPSFDVDTVFTGL